MPILALYENISYILKILQYSKIFPRQGMGVERVQEREHGHSCCHWRCREVGLTFLCTFTIIIFLDLFHSPPQLNVSHKSAKLFMHQQNLLYPSSQPLVTSEQLWKLIWNCRGLDVDDVKFVINYDYPSNSEDYIHRYGDPMIDRSSDYGKQILDKRALGWVGWKTWGIELVVVYCGAETPVLSKKQITKI